MPSFSASRQGRPKPSNIVFGRRRSDEKSMPSPSFNSSMSLGNVEDVFNDSSRSVDRLRHHYLALPSTPSTLCGGSSPGTRTERLPSLTDLFHHDILSPPSSGIHALSSARSDQGGEIMQRNGSMSSATSAHSQQWVSSFHHDRGANSIGPPATPLSPFFAQPNAGPTVSPTNVSPDRRSDTIIGYSDGQRTPRASPRSSCGFTVPSNRDGSSPICPGAPLIGVQSRGHFETQTWQYQREATSLGSFPGVQRRSPYGRSLHAQLPAEVLSAERAKMSRLETEMPRVAGLSGLGIYMDDDKIQSPFRKLQGAVSERALPEGASTPSYQVTMDKHTGLTPMVKASKVSDASHTPTRSKAKRSPSSIKTLSSEKSKSAHTKSSPSETAAKKKVEAAKTPLNKSRPLFRLDTGSGKKSKPKGHKMSPNASPWGVFGAKDGWKPLAPPNVSRAIAEANKLVLETASTNKDRSLTPSKTSPTSKRQAKSAPEISSPSKRSRTDESLIASSSPYKENVAPSVRSLSPSKRAHMLSPSHRNSPTALPLSMIR
ncbi:hypothetical protein EX895_000617 [Sporisorium graminicola]|uniref:Uncharacterized protein n=1 Tax=Sporisorium graminicola TaxID=280036 RepID=A0A4V6EUH4_9BASI|nr:hypothetical protein EX895_000617 [Sporisorium graminicola]TKY90619.1 hypothetical protein EX895_000617 [Sporisorium graminicola]